MTLLDFQKENAAEILAMFDAPKWEPILNAGNDNEWIIQTLAENSIRKLPNGDNVKSLFEGQLEFVVAPQVCSFLAGNRAGIINAKMGTGKTIMSNTIALLLFKKEYEPKNKGMNIWFLCSGMKHANKMKREAESILGDLAVIYIISSNPRKSVKHEISAEEAAELPRIPGKITYVILSKDTGKNTYKIKPMKEGMKCPKCSTRLNGKKKVGPKEIFKCSCCGEKTWHAVGGKPSIGEKLRKIVGPKRNKVADFLIVDEVHEMQNPTSLQSLMYQSLIRMSYRTLVMTGTLSNGYASSIFYILYPLIAKHFKKYGGFEYNKVGAFVDFFGSKRETATVRIDSNGSKRRTVKVEELPQINDRIVSFLAPFTTWFSMEDLNVEMPEFHEFIEIVDMDKEIEDQFKEWSERVNQAATMVKNFNLMHFKASSHYRVNNPTFNYEQIIKGKQVVNEYDPDQEDQDIILQDVEYNIPYIPLPTSFRSNKDKKLIQLVKSELAEGRRVMVYGVYNQSTGIYSRLEEILREEGINVGCMPDTVKAVDIEEWIINFQGDVLIVPQKRIATGLDLVMFHTVIFYEMDNQLRIVQQAKVRPWRPVGQTKEVRVYYIAFKGQQERELISMAQKMRAAATVEGEIIENDSIAAIYDYNPELTAAIAEIAGNIKNGEIESAMIRRELSPFEERYKNLLMQYSLSETQNNEDIVIDAEIINAEVETIVEEAVVENISEETIKELTSAELNISNFTAIEVVQEVEEIVNKTVIDTTIKVSKAGQLSWDF